MAVLCCTNGIIRANKYLFQKYPIGLRTSYCVVLWMTEISNSYYDAHKML